MTRMSRQYALAESNTRVSDCSSLKTGIASSGQIDFIEHRMGKAPADGAAYAPDDKSLPNERQTDQPSAGGRKPPVAFAASPKKLRPFLLNSRRPIAPEPRAAPLGAKCQGSARATPRRAVRLGALILLLSLGTGCSTLQQYRAARQVRRGDAEITTQNLEAALVSFQEAARLDPQLAVAHSRMGLIFRRMGEYEQAIHAYSEALRRDSSSFTDTFSLAELFHMTKRVKDAIVTYLRAVELNPDDFDAQLNLGVCYQQTGDFSQAAERFERAISLNGDRPHAFANLGVALDAQGKYYEAIRAFREALERDSRQPLLLVNLARTYMNQERYKMARQALLHALELDTNLAVAHEALGYCLFKTRDFGAAERAYMMAISCDPRLPRAHAGLGSIYMIRYLEDPTRIEEREKALEQWHRSLEFDSNQPRIRRLIAEYSPQDPDPDELLIRNGRTSP